MVITLRNSSGLHVYLPGLDDAKTPVTQTTSLFAPVRVRILYVDLAPRTVETGRKLLEYLGYRVTALTSSLEALEVFRHTPQEFDLVITDLAMPVISGLELAAALMELRADLPIILCSAYRQPGSREAARQLGLREILMYPATISDLARAIRRVLEA